METTRDAAITLRNARVWTGDPARPHATSVTLRGGMVESVGPTPAPPQDAADRSIDLGGRWVGPAFIDAHLHITLGAATLAQCNLAGCTSRDEFELRLRDHRATLDAAGERDAWLVGFGWNEADWKGDAPTREWLAAIDRPAVAWRMDQHSCVVNDAALALLDTSPIDGGEIEPEHGVFREQAAWKRVIPAIPAPSAAAKRANLACATAYLHSLGLAGGGSMEYLADIRDVYIPSLEALTFPHLGALPEPT